MEILLRPVITQNSNVKITGNLGDGSLVKTALDLGQVFRHIFLRIFINYSSFAGAVDINIKENL